MYLNWIIKGCPCRSAIYIWTHVEACIDPALRQWLKMTKPRVCLVKRLQFKADTWLRKPFSHPSCFNLLSFSLAHLHLLFLPLTWKEAVHSPVLELGRTAMGNGFTLLLMGQGEERRRVTTRARSRCTWSTCFQPQLHPDWLISHSFLREERNVFHCYCLLMAYHSFVWAPI